MKETGHSSVNGFALHIGLPRGENLYQIKRGHNSVSIAMAERIHRLYPQYSLGWILRGVQEAAEADDCCRLPLFGDLFAAGFAAGTRSAGSFSVSSRIGSGAEFAVRGGLSASDEEVLLFREADPSSLTVDCRYFLMADRMRGLCRLLEAKGDLLRFGGEGGGAELRIDRAQCGRIWLLTAVAGRTDSTLPADAPRRA